jgi:hypothetical protein
MAPPPWDDFLVGLWTSPFCAADLSSSPTSKAKGATMNVFKTISRIGAFPPGPTQLKLWRGARPSRLVTLSRLFEAASIGFQI